MEKKKLYRSGTDKVIAGVCGGLGEYFEVDSTIIRIIFVILAVWGGAGVILYIIGIIVMPERKGDKMKKGEEKAKKTAKDIGDNIKAVAEDFKENIKDGNVEHRGSVVFGLIILLLGIMFLLKNFFSWFDFDVFWPVILIIIGLMFIAGAGRRRVK